MQHLSKLALSLFLLSPGIAWAEAPALPSGVYTLDKAHSALIFDLNHLGISNYTASFDDFDATLHLDPAHPENAKLEASVDPRSLDLPHPPEGFKDELLGDKWLKTGTFPKIRFTSNQIEMTGDRTADVYGQLDFMGVKKPVILSVTFTGGLNGHPHDPHARVGFSATAHFKRSDFGFMSGLPEPSSKMGVGDLVEVWIETEFSGPELKVNP